MVLQRKLSGIVETCVLDDSYHMVTLDRQRPIVMDRVKEFAERLTRVARCAPRQPSSKPEAPQQNQGRGSSAARRPDKGPRA